MYRPGNIRELEKVIHRALLVCPGTPVGSEDLHLPSSHSVPRATPHHPAPAATGLENALQELFEHDLPNLYHQIDEAVMRPAFDYCEGNQVRTARLFGISRNIVRDRLSRYGLLDSRKARP